MTTKTDEISNEKGGFASDLAGLPCFFIDPEGAAKRVHSRWFWIMPLVVASVIGISVATFMMPIVLHVISVSPMPDGVNADEYMQRVSMFTKITTYLSPILTALIWALEAAVMLGIAVVSGVKARFGALFNLVAGCGLIQSLAGIATALILHFKGEVSSMAELKPAMGLDIFMPEGTSKYLVALGGAFSVFQIWWVVMLALVFAAAFRTSKGKGFAAALPLWVIGLAFSLIGAAFQK